MKKTSNEVKLLILLLLPVALVMAAHYHFTGFVVYNDGIGYYSYLRSGVIDKDINFSNEIDFFKSSYSKFSPVSRGEILPNKTTETGYTDTSYLIGNAVMWLPFFLAAHLATAGLGMLGAGIEANGYTILYEASIALANIAYGILGLLIIYKFCRKWFEKRIAFLATTSIWYGTSVFWYHAIEPSMAHINSLLLGAAFTYIWHATLGKRTKAQWMLLGILLGTIYLVRQQDALFGLLIAFEQLEKLAKNHTVKHLGRRIYEGLLFISGTAAAIAPQLLAWKTLHGKYFVFSYAGSIYHWTIPQILPFVLSPTSGMLATPALLAGLAGLAIFARKERGIAVYFLAIYTVQIMLTSSWSAWDSGYGLRFLTGMSIFAAIGMCEILKLATERLGSRAAHIAVLMLIGINALQMAGFLLGEISGRIALHELPKMLMQKIL